MEKVVGGSLLVKTCIFRSQGTSVKGKFGKKNR